MWFLRILAFLRQICAVPERWEDYYACLNRTEKEYS